LSPTPTLEQPGEAIYHMAGRYRSGDCRAAV